MLGAGQALLLVAMGIALYGITASIYGARGGDRSAWVVSGRRAVYALIGTVGLVFVMLELAFLRSDFAFDLVGTHSSTTTPSSTTRRRLVLAGGLAPSSGSFCSADRSTWST